MGKTKAVVFCVAASVLGVVVATSAMGRGGAAPAPTAGATTVPSVGEEAGERTVEDGGTGPFKAISVGDSSIPTHTIYRPKDLNAFGDRVKLPILAWGNGGCSNSNSGHQNYLSEIASHGFLVVAIGPAQAGGHGGTFGQQHGAEWAMVSTAWLKWQLKGDAEAGQLFTGNPSGLSKKEGWVVDKKNIP